MPPPTCALCFPGPASSSAGAVGIGCSGCSASIRARTSAPPPRPAGGPARPARPHVALAELISAHLVTEHASQAGTPATTCCVPTPSSRSAASTSEDARCAALHRVLDHYLHTSHSCCSAVAAPARQSSPVAPAQPGVTAEHLADHEQALAWFKAEHHVLVAITNLAAESGFDTCAWQLPWCPGDIPGLAGALARLGRHPAHRPGRRDPAGRRGERRPPSGVPSPPPAIRLGDYRRGAHASWPSAWTHMRLGDRAGEGRVLRDLGMPLRVPGPLCRSGRVTPGRPSTCPRLSPTRPGKPPH